MIKKFLLLSVVISQLTISCSKDDSPTDSSSDQNLETQISEISKLPYSSLKPEQQKVKLEADANDMLVQLDKSKTSGAIEAIENLGNLLGINTVDILNGKNENQIADVLNVSGVYGIYTWNSSNQIWVKTDSATELKFIFPAKENSTTNNAILSLKSTSSDIKVKLTDTEGAWTYDNATGNYTQAPSVEDEFFLPTSVDATLTINNAPAATFVVNSKYSNGKETPDESSYKMVLNDGYTFEMSGKKLPIEAKSSFTFEGKNIIEFNSGSTANIDELLKDNYLNKYLGSANGLIKLMDNFVIVVNTNNEGLTNDEAALEKSLIYPDYNSKTYYTDLNIYNKKFSEGSILANNNNVKMILVSKKDGTKIADVIQKSVKGYSYDSNRLWVTDQTVAVYGGYWDWSNNPETLVQEYDEVLYLKFNDSTEVEMSTYFSTGFDALNTKFEDFLKAFGN
ncbi:hypothetical protein DOS84_09150 [Flavobacterium aquariorum]|uniref:Lipoprotein n=1 Tax=Flavobacterium aquariorum TaxID=2217670 RepID=A0A2W7TVZ8_9FLAO|nr:hypothetical protein [Flavobacterium aquariorum]PZX93576.1 hypothetical protein DOS84_09150 [Flavobacterium aquariorum]